MGQSVMVRETRAVVPVIVIGSQVRFWVAMSGSREP
jgi:hypothetical protein